MPCRGLSRGNSTSGPKRWANTAKSTWGGSSNWMLIPARVWLLRDLPDNPAGVPGGEHAVRDVPRDHAPGPDDRLRADLHAGAEDRPAAHPHIGTDLDGPGELLPP